MIAEHEAEALGYLIGNNDEPCIAAIRDIENSPRLKAAFIAGWESGAEDLRKGERNIARDIS